MDGVFGSKTPLPVQAANFLGKSHCTSQSLQHTTLMDIRIKTIPQVTKAAVHLRMKFLSNSCQQEGNEASALIFPREIAGLSLKLMRQCLFTVELPLNKNGRKCFFLCPLHTPHTSHLLHDRSLEKNHSLSYTYAQHKAYRDQFCTNPQGAQLKVHRLQLK